MKKNASGASRRNIDNEKKIKAAKNVIMMSDRAVVLALLFYFFR